MRVAEGAAALTPTAPDCLLDWMRRAGLWSAADDAAVIARYGPGALDGHWWCCVAQPWARS
ncbi:hypothetical protein ACORG1_22940 [Mycobacterium sp. TJFP1]